MSGFAPDWLRLRESADHAARDRGLLHTLAARFAGREAVSVVDLGAGLGSNLRATAPYLPKVQRWVLVDHDPALLTAACEVIAAWADSHQPAADGIEARKGERSIHVELKRTDLAADVAPWGSSPPDLVTAAALFDLVSAQWIALFVAALTRDRIPFYTALTHDARTEWNPPHPGDSAMHAAFARHFGRDKGFGPAAGGAATGLIADGLAAAGYDVTRAPSPWRLGDGDAALIAALADSWAEAVHETREVAGLVIDDWVAARKQAGTNCVIGHEDVLAFPPRLVAADAPRQHPLQNAVAAEEVVLQRRADVDQHQERDAEAGPLMNEKKPSG